MFRNPFVKKQKRIVCIGGGNAMPKAVLSELKKYNHFDITVVSCALDSGGSTGRLRKDFNIIALGDARRAFAELLDSDEKIKSLLNYRFDQGELKGHVFGNILFSAFYLNSQGYYETFKKINDFLKPNRKILPATLSMAHLCAILEDGSKICGETNIDVPKHDANLKIKEVFLEPEARACPKAVRRIKKADVIIIGPGDLYSSILQIIMIDGMAEAINESQAQKVYVCNLMNKNGETNGFTGNDFVSELDKYLQGEIDYILFNNKEIKEERINNYKGKHPELLDLVRVKEMKNNFIGANLVSEKGDVVHDPKKLIKKIISLCKL